MPISWLLYGYFIALAGTFLWHWAMGVKWSLEDSSLGHNAFVEFTKYFGVGLVILPPVVALAYVTFLFLAAVAVMLGLFTIEILTEVEALQ